jgi:hypothetical protein
MTDVTGDPIAQGDAVRHNSFPTSRPWLHALAVYGALGAEAWIALAVISAVPYLDLPWSGFFVIGQAIIMAGTLGLIGWALNRTGLRWIWAGAIGLLFGLIGPNLLVIAGTFGPWLQGIGPALATLILYRGRARVTGIVTLSILVAAYIGFVVLIVIALSNWHFVF